MGLVKPLQYTIQWHISFEEIKYGLLFGLLSGENALGTVLASFGIIGVGASELVSYPYWCLEKGYAKYTGPREETEEWLQRTKGWLRVMNYDVLLSMVVYTIATVAFYLLGVAVLSLAAKIFWCAHESGTKKHLPEAIDCYSSSQRIL